MQLIWHSVIAQSRWMLTTLFVAAVGQSTGLAQNDSASIEHWRQLYNDRAAAVKAIQETVPDRNLTAVPQPIQAFSNPVRPDSQHGAVYLWTDQGRPRIIGAVWSALDPKDRTQRNLCYEFHSLSDQPLAISLDHCDVRWTPKDGEIRWQRLSSDPMPSKNRILRLTQMRQIIGEFRVENDTGESEIRFLPRPVYRYPNDVNGAEDGAIFSFVMGTDPELFLWIEAYREADDTSTWRIAPVRFTGTALRIERDDQLIWESPKWESYARDKSYDFLYGVEHFSAADAAPLEP